MSSQEKWDGLVDRAENQGNQELQNRRGGRNLKQPAEFRTFIFQGPRKSLARIWHIVVSTEQDKKGTVRLCPSPVNMETKARIKAFLYRVQWHKEEWGKARYPSSVCCEVWEPPPGWALHPSTLPGSLPKDAMVVLQLCQAPVQSMCAISEGAGLPGDKLAILHLLVLPFHFKAVKYHEFILRIEFFFFFKLQDARRRCRHVNAKLLNEKQDTWEGWAESARAQDDRLIFCWRQHSGNPPPPKDFLSERRGTGRSTQKSNGNWGPWLLEINGTSLGV